MKATNFASNKNARTVKTAINGRLREVENVLNEVRAEWAKVYPEVVKGILKEAKANRDKDLTYRTEQVLCRAKGIRMSDEEKAIIVGLSEQGLGYQDITVEYLQKHLPEGYVNEAGEVCYKNAKKEWVAVEKWTVSRAVDYLFKANRNHCKQLGL